MPRKAFLADVSRAGDEAVTYGVWDVKHGPDDGEFHFKLKAFDRELKIVGIVSEVSEYPRDHSYHIFGSEDAPQAVAEVLGNLRGTAGKTIMQLLQIVVSTLQKELSADDEDDDEDFLLGDSDGDANSLPDGSDTSEDDDWPGDDELDDPVLSGRLGQTGRAFRDQIRRDLTNVKNAGFKYGCLGGILNGDPCILSVSCRALKLGISEEAMRAWNIAPTDYIVLLLHYPRGYMPLEALRSSDNARARELVQFRVGKCHSYKPTLIDAKNAFAETFQPTTPSKGRGREDHDPGQSFRDLFISRPLNGMLNKRLVLLVDYRLTHGLTWEGAENFYNVGQGKSTRDAVAELQNIGPERVNPAFPKRVTSDHIKENTRETLSFPLVATQLFLRHFVRCTEFCLVCHCKLAEVLEAIKPYVCEKPLCLYQYMKLGFGPSIEHEIVSQPGVVDLLVSFCYLSAKESALKDFPVGMSLSVPSAPIDAGGARATVKAYQISFNCIQREAVFVDEPSCPVKTGDWVFLVVTDQRDIVKCHYQVADASLYPHIKLGPPVTEPGSASQFEKLIAEPGSGRSIKAELYPYDKNFDDLDLLARQRSILSMLDVLPQVNQMRDYLLGNPKNTLTSWHDRISPASLGLLRWIIASSRACILQLDDTISSNGASSHQSGEERLGGMDGWAQFRFAMGAPDKERRFLNSLRSVQERLKLTYPTLFAWHGSPLRNWHSIIREGLHFQKIANGRAFGNGVYHSLDCSTSLGYSQCYYPSRSNQNHGGWPGSQFKISSALALNEIVNAPKEFVNRNPHLVVAQLDWIQTRFLFVKTTNPEINPVDSKFTTNTPKLEQDPAATPRGTQGQIIIPSSAVSRSRRRTSFPIKSGNKKIRGCGSASDPIFLDLDEVTWEDDGHSVCTLNEDRAILEMPDSEESPPEHAVQSVNGRVAVEKGPRTDFVPGSLDISSLSLMTEPTWATSMASKRLQQELRTVLKTQSIQPLSALGWYVDERLTDNLYQWIVELHSFEPTLPLAQDMKARDVKSIVVEFRFGPNFPMSPPFVRVIRPRFRSFLQGGGGHVTAGGALCMELLTNSGWIPVSDLESVIFQVRMAMTSTDPHPARLEGAARGHSSSYSVEEAIQAYIRACNAHGWSIPPDFHEMARAGGASSSFSAY